MIMIEHHLIKVNYEIKKKHFDICYTTVVNIK